MKRFLSFVLAIVFCTFALVSCDTKSKKGKDDEDQEEIEKLPYEIEFVSNGDGTCYVNNIKILDADMEINLVIPEESDKGDTVTEIRSTGFAYVTPRIISVEAFDALFAKVSESDMRTAYTLKSFYIKYDLSQKDVPETRKQQWLKEHPYLAVVPFYFCDDTITKEELEKLDNILLTYADFGVDDLKSAYSKIVKAIDDSSLENKEEMKTSFLEKYGSVIEEDISCSNNIVSIELPSTLKTIGENVGVNFIDLEEIVIPDGVETIGANAFKHCTSLKSIVIGEGVSQLFNVFFECPKLESVVVSKTVGHIDYAFVGYDIRENDINLFYEGSESDLTLVDIRQVVVYSYSETEPSEEGLYWHYVDGKPTKW